MSTEAPNRTGITRHYINRYETVLADLLDRGLASKTIKVPTDVTRDSFLNGLYKAKESLPKKRSELANVLTTYYLDVQFTEQPEGTALATILLRPDRKLSPIIKPNYNGLEEVAFEEINFEDYN